MEIAVDAFADAAPLLKRYGHKVPDVNSLCAVFISCLVSPMMLRQSRPDLCYHQAAAWKELLECRSLLLSVFVTVLHQSSASCIGRFWQVVLGADAFAKELSQFSKQRLIDQW